MTIEERFWLKSTPEPNTGCWLWIDRSGDRYGQFWWGRGRRPARANRMAWELTHGQIPVGMFVCHRCDNPACVNPDHLFLGTCADNVRDMMRKGRNFAKTKPDSYARGERQGSAKLTGSQVMEIRAKRASGATWAVLAREYGVCAKTISNAATGKRWRHIGAAPAPREEPRP